MAMSECVEEIKFEVYEKLNEIIHLQSGALNDLLMLTMQHRDVNEADLADIKTNIDKAAMIKSEIGL